VSVVMLRAIRARRQKLAGETVVVAAVGHAGVSTPRKSAAVLAAKSHRAKQKRKAEQDAFEREVAFQYFHSMPRARLASQMRARLELDRIARTLFATLDNRRSLKETRRRVAGLRKEFLRLRA
jgi:hypothetical protein